MFSLGIRMAISYQDHWDNKAVGIARQVLKFTVEEPTYAYSFSLVTVTYLSGYLLLKIIYYIIIIILCAYEDLIPVAYIENPYSMYLQHISPMT